MSNIEVTPEDMIYENVYSLKEENLEQYDKIKSIKKYLKSIVEMKKDDPVFINIGVSFGQKELAKTILEMLNKK